MINEINGTQHYVKQKRLNTAKSLDDKNQNSSRIQSTNTKIRTAKLFERNEKGLKLYSPVTG